MGDFIWVVLGALVGVGITISTGAVGLDKALIMGANMAIAVELGYGFKRIRK